MRQFYLSFADDSGFLGACIVYGDNEKNAHYEASKRGLNPGGDVRIVERDPGREPISDDLMYKLMSLEDLRAAGLKPVDSDVDQNVAP